MATVRPNHRRRRPPQRSHTSRRLPLRWAIIAIVTLTAAVIGETLDGPITAITVAAAVLTAAHHVLD